jgi:hypothetical protein
LLVPTLVNARWAMIVRYQHDGAIGYSFARIGGKSE